MTGPAKNEELVRVPTGIEGLDTILHGGLMRGGVYIVQGCPGSGKTIFGNQVAFHHAQGESRAIYATLLAENHARMLQHLSSMAFFDRARIPDGVCYLSGFRTLEDGGLVGLLELLRREITSRRATLLVMDGLLNAATYAPSKMDYKKFIHSLQSQAGFANCTVLLLTSEQIATSSPEMTMVDGVVELHREITGVRPFRRLVVPKFRGSDSLGGSHFFEITDAGVTVHPRLEGLYAEPSRAVPGDRGKLSVGIERLDAMLGGGLPRHSMTLVLGATGTGKTTLGLHFLAKSSAQEPGLHFGFYEMPEDLCAKAAALGLDLRRQLDSGAVELLWQAPTENLLDGVGHRLLDAVRRRGVRRLLIDGWGGFRRITAHPERLHGFFTALANELRALGVTAVTTIEMQEFVGPEVRSPLPDLSSIVENAILLRYVEANSELLRFLSILKVRASDFDSSLHRFAITSKGIEIGEPFHRSEAILSGYAHDIAPAPRPGTLRAPGAGDPA